MPDVAAPTLYVAAAGGRAATDPKKMTARALLASEARDRQGDVIVIAGIDLSRHEANPVVLVDHGKWHPLPVGRRPKVIGMGQAPARCRGVGSDVEIVSQRHGCGCSGRDRLNLARGGLCTAYRGSISE